MKTYLEIVLPLVAFAVLSAVIYLGLRRLAKVYTTAAPETVDAVLYVAVAVLLAAQGVFGSETAYSYVNPYVLFWLKTFCVILGSGALQLKAYRSGRKKPSESSSANK